MAIPKKPKAEKPYKTFFGIGQLEPKLTNFNELAKQTGKRWKDVPIQQQAQLLRHHLTPNHSLMEPTCSYMKYWDVIIMISLLYTALITPYEVAFLDTVFNTLFVVNRCIDVIFVKDIVLQFRLKKCIVKRHTICWLRDHKSISANYLRGWFLIDFLSVLPFDTLGFIFQSPVVQRMKLIRIIRILRLLKIVRVLRASRIVKRWQDHTGISYSLQGLIKFAIMLCVASHWMACLWGGVGVLLGTSLSCVAGQPQFDDDVKGQSWITGKSWAPDNPCKPIDVYVASLHFAVMTITSIGYGDITPGRRGEYAIGILCQLVGGLTWAYVIGSICGIIANSDPIKMDFENRMDALNRMLHEQNIQPHLRFDLREYLREQSHYHHLERAREIAQTFSPQLQGRLLEETVIGDAIQKVWYFHGCHPEFLVKLTALFTAAQFSRGDHLGGANMLYIVQRGSIGCNGRILLPGDFFGEDMIMSSNILLKEHVAFAMGFVFVLHLEQSDLEALLETHPVERLRIRRAACMIAFRLAVRFVASQKLHQKTLEHHTQPLASGETVKCVNTAELHGLFDEAHEIKKRHMAVAKKHSLTLSQAQDFFSQADSTDLTQPCLSTPTGDAISSQDEGLKQKEPLVEALVESVEHLRVEVRILRDNQDRAIERLIQKSNNCHKGQKWSIHLL